MTVCTGCQHDFGSVGGVLYCFLSVNAGFVYSTAFKDQKSADVVRSQLSDLGTKINQQVEPVFTSKKIANHLRVTEDKPPLINQQSVAYEFICDSCDTNYIGYPLDTLPVISINA